MSEDIKLLKFQRDEAWRCHKDLLRRNIKLEAHIAELEGKLKEIRKIKKLVENKDGDEIRNSHDTGAAWDVGFERGYNNALKDCQRIASEDKEE